MRYLVSMSELKQEIKFLETQLEIIDDNVVKLNNIKDSVEWEGIGYESFLTHYTDYIDYLNNLEKRIISYIKFITSYYDKYGNKYSELRGRYSRLYDKEV